VQSDLGRVVVGATFLELPVHQSILKPVFALNSKSAVQLQ